MPALKAREGRERSKPEGLALKTANVIEEVNFLLLLLHLTFPSWLTVLQSIFCSTTAQHPTNLRGGVRH